MIRADEYREPTPTTQQTMNQSAECAYVAAVGRWRTKLAIRHKFAAHSSIQLRERQEQDLEHDAKSELQQSEIKFIARSGKFRRLDSNCYALVRLERLRLTSASGKSIRRM